MTGVHRTAGNARVVVLGLAGTIAMTASGGSAGVTPQLTADELVAAVPGLAGCGIDVVERQQRRSLTSATPVGIL